MKRLALLATFAFSVCALYAQTPSASVVGRVSDASGAVIPGAEIKVTNVDTNIVQKGKSNEVGDFTVPYLNPGNYTLEVTATGFRTYRHAKFALAVDQVLRMDVPLDIGTSTETVTVTAEATVLNTETATRGEVTTQDEIKEMPLEGRNFSDLALLTGGVLEKGDGGDGNFAVNGARADNGGFLLDGVNNTQRRNTNSMISPPIEGVQEFKMLTAGFSAEYGRYAGGMLTVVTKSGTNSLRGSVYEFMRNDAFDASAYFDAGAGKSKLRRNQFGATLGGPVYIPKLFNGKNKTFFLVTWDSLRSTAGKTQRALVPTPEMLRGDFSKVLGANGKPVVITDFLAKTPFPNNQIPTARLNPVSMALAKYFPTPNLSDGSPYNFIAQGNSTSSFNNIGIKVDHNLTEKDRITASVFWKPNHSWDPVMTSRSPLPIFGSTNDTLDLLTYIRYLKTVTPTMFLEASANFSRKTNNQVWPYSADQDWGASVGFTGGTKNPVAAGLPYVTITGYMNLGPAYDIPKIWTYNNYQYAATLTWIKGRHNLKYGGDFLREQYFSRNYGDTRGRLAFINRFTGDPMADFVLGWADSTRRQLDATGPYDLISSYSGFVQDDFKVSSSLTLNIGLRYDLMKQPKEKYGAMAQFIPTIGKVVVAGTGNMSQQQFDELIAAGGLTQWVTKASDVGLPDTIVKTDKTNFGPRFGFAWRMFGNNKTVLRGGYGIFYGQSSLYRKDDYSDTYPFGLTETYSRTTSNPLALTLSDPYPLAKRSFSGVTGSYGQERPDLQSQYIQSFNLSLSREFLHGTVVEVAYAGSKGTHLERRFDINQTGRSFETRNLRPYAGFGSIQIINDGSNSFYNSGQVTIQRRFTNQLTLRSSYTYAKAIDESSNTGGTIAYNFSSAQDSRNLKLERGRADFDIGHAFSTSLIWTPKWSRNILARNWQVSSTTRIQTGPPFTPRVANFNYTNGEASRPDRIAKGTVDNPTPDRWFDKTAFVPVPTNSYRFGTSGRNILDGPGLVSINMGLSRRFRFGDRGAVQFRAESFNLPNHPNFSLPENNVDTLVGGTINRAKNNRNIQLGLRVEF